MSQYAIDFAHHDAEAFIVRRLADHRVTVYICRTDPSVGKERIRAAIVNNGLEYAVVGKNTDGKVENYLQIFERFYGEPLVPKQSKRGKA